MDWLSATSNFLLIVKEGSFAEAARKRYTSASALSKQIAWLEDHLQTKLLHRTTRQLNLTQQGERFFIEAERIVNSIQSLNTEILNNQDTVSGKIRVVCPLTTSYSHLAFIFPRFLEVYPETAIELVTCAHQRNVIAEGFDIAIRREPADDPRLCHRFLGKHNVQNYAAPSYLEKFSLPKEPLELLAHNCLVHDADIGGASWQFRDHEPVQVSGNYVSNHLGMVVRAAVQGLGVIQVPDTVVAEIVEQGKLVPILEPYTVKCISVYAVYLKQAHQPKVITACLDFLENCNYFSDECRVCEL